MTSQQREHARQLLAAIGRGIPAEWDGREAITYLRDRDYQWRQMEWIGFYFERRAKDVVSASGLPVADPFQYGNVQFDLALDSSTFDLKAHVTKRGADWIILNDREAIEVCLSKTGSWGAIIACGSADKESDGSFKAWHDAMKGKMSAYEEARIKRGVKPRTRKTAFRLERLLALCVDSPDLLGQAYQQGWMRNFQEKQRNADGSPRRAKIACALSRVPEAFKIECLTVARS